MSDRFKNEYTPDTVSPPGETLEEVLEERGLTQVELAGRTGLTTKTINLIIKGKHALTPETALKLERVLSVPASFWNKREQAYRDYLARSSEEKRLKEQVEWLKELPVNKMVEYGWIRKFNDKIAQVRELLQYFGVTTVEQWNKVYLSPQASFRKSQAFKSDPGALAAWMRKGEVEAMKVSLPDFDTNRFKKVLKTARGLTRNRPDKSIPQLRNLCADAGVVLVLVPEIPRARANGLTRWIGNKAIIQLSLYGKYADMFWFTFFHEAGHIIRHGKKDVFLEHVSQSSKPEGDQEDEANRFAADSLIPRHEYIRFTSISRFSKVAVERFANQVGIAPGIVVGRLQHDRMLPHAYMNGLREKYEWVN